MSDLSWVVVISAIILIEAIGFYEWNRREIVRRLREDKTDA